MVRWTSGLIFLLCSVGVIDLARGQWTGVDVGNPGVAGTDGYDAASDTYTLQGSGADIGGTADGCRFVYQTLTGDGVISARVTSIQAVTALSKAGVMIRQDVTAGSASGTMLLTAGSGTLFASRAVANGPTVNLSSSLPQAVPYWVKLVKDGTLISSFRSNDGENWAYIGATRLSLGAVVQVGLAVTSNANGISGSATFDHVVVSRQLTYAPTLPWFNIDIGAPLVVGQTHVEDNLWSIFGGGTGLTGVSDQFRYAYQRMNGNGLVQAEVQGLGTVGTAGIVMRQDTTAGSVEACVLLRSNLVVFVTRATPGGSLLSNGGKSLSQPGYGKLVRTGNVFSGYYSPDGSTWTLLGRQVLAMPPTINAGLVSTSNSSSNALSLAVLDHVQVIPDGKANLTGAIDTGFNSSYYIQPNGQVWSWGFNSSGELGDGTTTSHAIPAVIPALSDIVRLSSGNRYAVALKKDGTVYSWGLNNLYSLGNGTSVSQSAPTQILNLNHVVSLATGGSHTLALRDDGSVWSWGLNSSSQLGNGTSNPGLVPAPVTGLSGIVAVASGFTHSLALQANGSVWAWGSNASGQLGNGTLVPHSFPIKVVGLDHVVAISASAYGSYAIKDDGSVWACGLNNSGQLGDGTTTSRSAFTEIPALQGMTTIQAGNNFAIGLKNDGSVWSWGSNLNGQLGNGLTTGIQLNPVRLAGLSGVTALATKAVHTCAVTNTGLIYAWGSNFYGQLGNSTPSVSAVPILVNIGQSKPVITSALSATLIAGVPFTYQITAKNSPSSYSASGLPLGLSINTASGLISGTPTSSNPFTVILSATNSFGTGSAPLVLNRPIPVITSATTVTASPGTAFSYQITATNLPKSFSAQDLPTGLSLNSATGLITGIIPTAGTVTIVLQATNANGSGTALLKLTLGTVAAPVLTSAATAQGQIGIPFSYAIIASNNPTSYSTSALPSGLTVNSATGIISGSPTASGVYPVTLRATNSFGTGIAILNITVQTPPPVITSALTAAGTVGSIFFPYTIEATYQPTSFSALGLPSGLVLDPVTGIISGTPTVAGTYSVTLSASNATGKSLAALLTVVISSPAAPVMTSAATANGVVGTLFSYTITGSDNPTGFSATGLPNGLTLDAATGVISGTPTQAGVFTITLGATNGSGTGNASLTLNVTAPAPVITSSLAATGSVGTPIAPYLITASNNPTSFSATGLPPGLNLNASSGQITGTPTSPGSFSVSLGALNPQGTGTATLVFTITQPAPIISSALTATATLGQPFSYQIVASNQPVSFTATGLPAGLTINEMTGLIGGAPTVLGSVTLNLGASNSGGTGTATLTLTVKPPAPTINSSLSVAGVVGLPFSYNLTASNSPTAFSATGLPPGLIVNSATGAITGTPNIAGQFLVSFGATNTGGTGTAAATFTITQPAPVITSLNAASGTIGQTFAYTITATNAPTGFTAVGLPPGLTLNPTSGIIGGTPTAVGITTVQLGATNAGGTGTASLTLTIKPLAPVITSSLSASGSVGSAVTPYILTASNGPTNFAASGLPPGLTLNPATGQITGTPTAAGSFSVTVTAQNSGGSGTALLVFIIKSAPPLITSAPTGNATVGQPFSYTVQASNNPTSFTATNLPAGLIFNPTTGIIGGTPTAAGTYTITLGASNSGGSASAPLTLIIRANTIPSPWSSLDLGVPTASGQAEFANGIFSVTAQGGDIAGTADTFNFLSQPLNGDGVLITQVSNQINSNGFAKAGPMLREGTAPGAKYIALVLTPSNGLRVLSRDTVNGNFVSTAVTGVVGPVWLKIDRRGPRVWFAYSKDGNAWTPITNQATSLGTAVQAGLAVSSHSTTASTSADFSNVQLLTGSTTGNGLPDWWAKQYYGTTAVNPNSDPTGKGTTLLQDYQQNSDPTNYYSQNGKILTPSLTVVSGNNQSSDSSTLTPQPLIIQVTNGGMALAKAPITWVAPGRFALTNQGVPVLSTSPQVTTNALGQAQVYYQLAAVPGANAITATAGAGSILLSATGSAPGSMSSGDGLPDKFKTQYGFDLAANNGPYDADGEGISNLQHYFNTTNPMVNTYLIPYLTGFEASEGYQAGNLDGQNGWRDPSNGGQIQTGSWASGAQAVSVTGAAAIGRRFYTLKSNVTLQAQVYLSSAGLFSSQTTNLPTGIAALVSYNPTQGIMAFQGNGAEGGTWVAAPNTLKNDQWVTLTLLENYAAKTWSLQVNGTTVLTGLGFKSNTATRFIDFNLQNGNASQTYLDNLSFSAL